MTPVKLDPTINWGHILVVASFIGSAIIFMVRLGEANEQKLTRDSSQDRRIETLEEQYSIMALEDARSMPTIELRLTTMEKSLGRIEGKLEDLAPNEGGTQ